MFGVNPAHFPRIVRGQPALVLAPMEGVLDAPLRQLYSELGGFLFAVSEFVRVSSAPLPGKVLLEAVPELRTPGCRAPGGLPVQVQLLGSHPGFVAETALRAVQLGATAIDLNFGCPSATVNRNGGGAVLLKDPARIAEIVREVRAALGSSLPVSAKIRLGWDDARQSFAVIEALVSEKVDWIVVHARTRQQGYAGVPDWAALKELVALGRSAEVPVVANGDILSARDRERCAELSGAEHFMIGRGALAHPALALELAGKNRNIHFSRRITEGFDPEDIESWRPVLLRFVEICSERGAPESYILRRLKQWLGWAANGNALIREWVHPFKRAQTLAEALQNL